MLAYMSDIEIAREQYQNFFAMQFIIEMTASLEKKSQGFKKSKKAEEVLGEIRLKIGAVKEEIRKRDAVAEATSRNRSPERYNPSPVPTEDRPCGFEIHIADSNLHDA